MPIRFKCQHCGSEGEMPDDRAGQLSGCPACGGVVDVPSAEWTTPNQSLQTSRRRSGFEVPSWPDVAPYVWKLTLAACVLTFLFTIRTPPGPLVLLHYICLMVAVGMLGDTFAKRFTLTWSVGIAFVAAVAAAFLWGHWDYSIKDWEERGEGETGRAEYRDYVYRGHDHPFFRIMYLRWDKGGYYRAEGGFSDSGKQHGEWEHYSSDDFRRQPEWFWYGEPVSEGEWQLRNR